MDRQGSAVPETQEVERFWDERYGSHDQLFSGAPNAVLVTEVAGLPPGQALDVGCGEGGDACWLAGQGWHVTAVDISHVALRRAAARNADLTRPVSWTRADLTAVAPPAGAFDLVSVQYFPLPHRPGHAALRRLLAAVAPGGILLVAGHAPVAGATDHGSSQNRYYQPGEIAAVLDGSWVVQVDETRARTVSAPEGTHHTHDVILRAQRTG